MDSTTIEISGSGSIALNPAWDQGLTPADVQVGYGLPEGDIDVPEADQKKIVVPIDIPWLLDKLASDVWPKTDAGTGEIPDTGVGEGDVPGLIGGIKDMVGSIGGAITGIGDAITGFFDTPAEFQLDMDGFSNIIIPQKFPFCIPFDFINAIKVFAKQAQDYQLVIDFDTEYFSVNHVVDLSPFAFFFAFFRYGVTVWFVFILIMKTRSMIKW